MIKAIIFDLDGVIVDSEAVHTEAEALVLEKNGVRLTKEQQLELVGKPFREGLVELGVSAEKIPALIQQKAMILARLRQNIGVIPPTYRFIKEKCGQYRFALVTSSLRYDVDRVLEQVDLTGIFEVTVTADDVDLPKPNPAPYLAALNGLQLAAEECLVIEDSVSGIQAAKAAGLCCVALLGTFPEHRLKAADLIVSEISEASLQPLLHKSHIS
jgi:beta-phosphoglucomutase